MPNLIVDLDKLEHNIQFIKAFCAANQLEWVGVVKGCESSVPVIELFQRSGVTSLGIASLVTAREQQRHFREKPMLVAIPSALEAQAVVTSCGSSLNSELETIKALAEAAEREGVTHEVLLMIEVGDLREGVMPEDAVRTVRKILELGSKHLELSGIGANLACCSGVLPSSENVSLLNGLAEEIEKSLGHPMKKVSIGGSVMLDWMETHSLPPRLNQLRIGEAILLGTIPGVEKKHKELLDSAFLLSGTVLEIKTKPSVPMGEVGTDAFGVKPQFEDKGLRKRALVNLGAIHTAPRSLQPVPSNVRFINSNSNYSVYDVTDCPQEFRPGDTMEFRLSYSSLIQGLLSPYVKKSYRGASASL
ncbi:putative amino acid racemase [Cystobacter fuscus DSM 2262]|uniref:Amino acid racemase n=1 Tax=Cystobacter fuscus (strain ATCC 25194 / DSM 2262 / NBRC 100088 / M29) TaxID=1242864 RepID=S9NVL1_CYSF2|nr:alanine racemase [Cystobacter fuscus]EPX56220.1 putative amino acid racemase [Cystobacter fuscus DSM 2262]